MPSRSPAFVINETLARRNFGDSDPIGARFRAPFVEQESSWATVVGVVADTKLQRLDGPVEPEVFVDYAHAPLFGYATVASVTIDAAAAAAEVRRSAAGVDAAVPVLEVKTLEAALADSIAPYRFNLFTFGLFAAVALLLASVGIYGTLAYSTSRRTQEIGIRLALGAARGEVVAMVIRQGMTVALIGTLVGLVIGVAVARVMRGLLYEVSPSDPLHFRRSLRRAASGGIRGLAWTSPAGSVRSTFGRASPRVMRAGASGAYLGRGIRIEPRFRAHCAHASTNHDVRPDGHRRLGDGGGRRPRRPSHAGPCRGRRTVVPISRVSGPTTA